jgi:serine/threonine protein kinase
VLQGDPKPQNFLLKEDNNVVLIDFGIAKKLIPSEINMFDKLIEQAEQGNSTPLRAKLTQMERPDYKCLDILIFRPTTYTSGKVVYTTLAPAIHLSEKIALQYKSGICKMRSILPPREKLSPETIAEAKRIDERNAQIKAKESEKRPSETEPEPEVKKIKCEKEEKGWCSVMGGKRHTKYVGTRRHKKSRTRRKV